MNWREELPDPVEVPLDELSDVVRMLEAIFLTAQRSDDDDLARQVDAVIGQMTRWIWPLLGDLDED